MRTSIFARFLFLLLILASPVLVLAQFQQPTAEELSMTADPKAPGAAAVYLYYEETSDVSLHVSGFYVRIKVLTEKGKELATVSMPYERGLDEIKDKDIEGRTIHADGTVIPLDLKASDLMEVKTKGFQINSVVFNLPSVEVGSILEYRVKFHRDEGWTFQPTWQVQKPYFVHRAHYTFRPGYYQNLLYTSYVGSGAKVEEKKGVFTLDITDVPPEPDEDWMPPMNTLRWHVEFFYSQSVSNEEFWLSARKNWAIWVQDFTKPTSHLKEAVAENVAPDDSEEVKAKKIYTAVMKLENTVFTREKSKAERKKDKLKDINKAEDVWKQKSGSSNDIALLYAAMARAAGLKVWPMRVIDRNRAMLDESYLSTRQLDDYIVIVELGGKKVYLDPGQKMCPFGSMHWKHTWTAGFELTDKGAIFATTPGITFKESTVKRTANLDIDAAGNVKGYVLFATTGPQALYWRQMAIMSDEQEVKKQFNESMRDYLPEGVQADFDHFIGLDDSNAILVGIVNVSGNIGSATGKHFFLPGLFFESNAKHPFVAQEKRITPIDVHYPTLEQDEVTYHLPSGFNIESTPQDANTVWPDHAMLNIHSNVKDGSVTVLHTLAYNFTLLNQSNYSSLHDFYLKVAAADQQQLVLARAPLAKGN